ncbi:cobalbumin biosynthesis protein [Desulfurispirillum indicum S5]|uniref:Adenosylcobinamide kinase n=1 Tax=Desulfurispirillum indicum (strain ATCC BAA-1389 / DSM 22839 / S5) TaxID=653733 RepID=E6W2Z7_DESIS|nr:bifunctional adenosylcobinamide kinase/adenosylcobinamide-phosphate guanylyltransferase [Desulfurispirillum indicum]ADU66822.1 cobalbumin biosynthesis protein [Desulfurispirillum indicum S5]
MSRTITLISGGVGSGKTSHALALAAPAARKAYIATAPRNLDGEMDAKILRHQAERDETYFTIEEPLDLAAACRQARVDGATLIIIDCLTLWVSNIIFREENGEARLADLLEELGRLQTDLVIVTNEVNLGVIPADATTRRYCALLARVNRRVAEAADQVLFMVSGIAMGVK